MPYDRNEQVPPHIRAMSPAAQRRWCSAEMDQPVTRTTQRADVFENVCLAGAVVLVAGNYMVSSSKHSAGQSLAALAARVPISLPGLLGHPSPLPGPVLGTSIARILRPYLLPTTTRAKPSAGAPHVMGYSGKGSRTDNANASQSQTAWRRLLPKVPFANGIADARAVFRAELSGSKLYATTGTGRDWQVPTPVTTLGSGVHPTAASTRQRRLNVHRGSLRGVIRPAALTARAVRRTSIVSGRRVESHAL